MSFIINGTTINSIKFNNTDINTLICNGEEVYSGVPAIYNTVKNASSNVTESQWLEFIDNDCIALAISRGETADFIGKDVTLSNSVVSNYTSWKIADFGHDSSGNTVDLIQNNTIYKTTFGYNQKYSSSTARSWLIGNYLPGFSTDVKNKLQTMTVTTDGGNTNDKIKLLSGTEVGGTHQDMPVEGTKYPIFTSSSGTDADSSRVRTGTNTVWWLRPRRTNYASFVWIVTATGNLSSDSCSYSFGLVPCIRFA